MNSVNMASKANCNTIAFKGNEQKKHPIAAVASFILPGTGQIINGEPIKGIKFFAAAMLLWITRSIFKGRKLIEELKTGIEMLQPEKVLAAPISKTKLFTGLAIGFAVLANRISSAVDAYKGKQPKPETTEKA